MDTIIDNTSEYILIPNPIYDVVFKYLMEDLESAKIILSTLINQNIKNIQIEPSNQAEKKEFEQIPDPKTKDDIRLFHLDFVATIELPDGTDEMIMIELQKASEPGDIFRFKRYISKNFQKKQEKEIIDPKTQSITKIENPIRLIPIFILNFRIENEVDDLLIKTNRIKTGIFKNRELEKHNEFIDNLLYDIWVVQLPNVKNIKEEDYEGDEYKSRLFALLKLFDQRQRERNNEHRLKVIKKYYPKYLERVIKRLQAASIENPNLEEQMYAEDEYLKALIERDNKLSALELILEKKEKAIEEKEKVIYNLARLLKKAGIPIKEIQKQTGLSTEVIEKL